MRQNLSMSQSWPAPLSQLILEGWEALQRGHHPAAVTLFRKALAQEPNIPEAHLGLALASRPGPDYLDWLAWLHQTLAPACYLEIGVETGQSLRLARPPTRAIGIDPAPQVGDAPFAAATEILPLTSQDFLTDSSRATALVGGIDFAFIDGDHRFPTVLADFLELERLMAPGGVIALHDVWPLDELTAAPERASGFYAGDGWKLLPCLRAVRPDLDILTIAAAPTGLALVGGFSVRSSLLRDRYPDLCSAFGDLPYATLARDPDRILGLVGNDEQARAQIGHWLSAVRGRASSSAKSSAI